MSKNRYSEEEAVQKLASKLADSCILAVFLTLAEPLNKIMNVDEVRGKLK